MTTPGDLRTDLEQIPVPTVPMDQILRRGRQLRRRKTLTTTFAVVTSLAVVAFGAATWDVSPVDPDSIRNPAPAGSVAGTAKLSVFLLDEITPRERRVVRAEAQDLEGVVSIRYISKRAAYREFTQQYRNEPEFWENLPEDALPALFIVDLADPSDVEEAVDRLEGLAGVDEVGQTFSEQIGTAGVYPLVAEDGGLRVFAPIDRPYGLCPGPAETLTEEDLQVAEQAVLLAAPEISAGLDTGGAYAVAELVMSSAGPPDFASMIDRDCGSFATQGTALVTLHLPEVDSASMGATTYFVSHEPRGWVIWGAW